EKKFIGMKNNSTTSKIILLIILILSVKFSGCEQEDLDFYIDCDYCMEEIPLYDTLWVSLTINEENPYVPLKFYLGDYDNGTEDWIDTAYSGEFWLVSEVDVKYSVKATYKRGDETIVAIDSDKIKAVNGEEECYAPCYYVRAGTLDVRLAK
nr:hypothetical protein [Bacteroidales bacterium]